MTTLIYRVTVFTWMSLFVILSMFPLNNVYAQQEPVDLVALSSPDPEDMFTVFEGMRITPRLYDDKILSLEFYSKVGLWYAIMERVKFSSYETTLYSHILDPSLISPMANWIDLEGFFDFDSVDISAVRTFMPIAKVDCNLAIGNIDCNLGMPGVQSPTGEVKMVLFRNNPYSLDAPQLMNTMTAIGVGIRLLKGGKLDKKFTSKVYDFTQVWSKVESAYKNIGRVKRFLQGMLDALDVLKVICDFAGEYSEEASTLNCNSSFEKFEQLKEAMETLKNLSTSTTESEPLSLSMEDISKKWTGLKDIFKSPKEMKSKLKSQLIHKLASFPNIAKETIVLFFVQKLGVELIAEPIFLEGISHTNALGKIEFSSNHKMLFFPKNGIKEIVKESEIAEALWSFYKKRKEQKGFELSDLGEKRELILATLFESLVTHGLNHILTGEIILDIQNKIDFTNFLFKWIHQVKNLRASVVNLNTSNLSLLVTAVGKAVLAEMKESGAELTEELIKDILASLSPLKIVKQISAAGQGSKMLWDAMTKPNIMNIHLQRIEEDDGIHIKFSLIAPSLDAVRYLIVDEEYADYLFDADGLACQTDKSSCPLIDGTGKKYYPTSAEPLANHFLVRSGFQASVENHAVFSEMDKGAIEELVGNKLGKGKVMWHAYRHSDTQLQEINAEIQAQRKKINESKDGELQLITVNLEAPKERNDNNAFRGTNEKGQTIVNYWERTLSNNIFKKRPYESYSKREGNILLDHYLEDNKTNNIEYLDFSKVFGPGLLKHITPGVYTDLARFTIGDADDVSQADRYDNTFHVYVLSDLTEIQEDILNNDLVYVDYRKKGTFLRMIDGSIFSATDFYVYVKTSDGNFTEYFDIGKNVGNIELDSAIPLDNSTTVYMYNDVLATWANVVGRDKLREFLIAENWLSSGFKPVISFSLDEIPRFIGDKCDFFDVNEDSYYTKSIKKLCALGVIDGYGDGTFGVGNKVSRAEFLKMALLTYELTENQSMSITELEALKSTRYKPTADVETVFGDVKKDHWASGYIYHAYADDKKIVKGYSDGRFYPDEIKEEERSEDELSDGLIARVGAAKILAKLFVPHTVDPIGKKCPEYTDMQEGEWYCKFLTALKDTNIMKGYADGSFGVGDKMSREDVTVAACRAYAYKRVDIPNDFCDVQ